MAKKIKDGMVQDPANLLNVDTSIKWIMFILAFTLGK